MLRRERASTIRSLIFNASQNGHFHGTIWEFIPEDSNKGCLPGFFNHSSQSCFYHSFTNPLPSAETCPIYSANFEIGAPSWFLLFKSCLKCTSKVKMVDFHSVSVTPVCILTTPLTIGYFDKINDSHVCITFL